MSNFIWHDLNKTEHLAHYGVKGMKWHKHRKGLTISNDTDAYRYDPSGKYFKDVVAKTKIPGRSKTSDPEMWFNSGERNSEGKMVQKVSVTKTASTIDKGKELIDNILKDIGNFFLTMFNKKH